MNDNLQNELAKLINATLEKANSAGEFIPAETPEVIEQAMMWHGVKSFSLTVVCLVAMLLIATSFNLGFKKGGFLLDEYGDYFNEKACIYVPISSLVFAIFATNLDFEWLQIWIAPKLWLIEYASGLVK